MQSPAQLVLQGDKLVERVAPKSLVQPRAGLELDGHAGDFRVLAEEVQPERPVGIRVCVEVEGDTDSCLG
jgi:acyl-[acyl carrier protein]--UDP-N-acetylglucosamine O-acyltransferase